MVDHDRIHDMVTIAFSETTLTITKKIVNVEEPNFDEKCLMKC